MAELLSNLVSIFFVGRLQTSQGLDAANLHKWGRVFSDKSGCRMVKTMLCAVNERQKKTMLPGGGPQRFDSSSIQAVNWLEYWC